MRIRIIVNGIVQGVGFRPFVFRLARQHGLSGWVRNTPCGVEIEVQGAANPLECFCSKLESEKPALSRIESIQREDICPRAGSGFEIIASDLESRPEAVLLPDTAICTECVRELFSPENRRFGYPFITCTLCGPRFSIAEALPFDRERTSMRDFQMCAECRREYEDPGDRRFHSQTNACQSCGPSLRLLSASGEVLATGGNVIAQTAALIRSGKIVALKGIGGYQLLLDATNDDAVSELRRRKRRPSKPFALMVPSLEWAERLAGLNDAERQSLLSWAAPIVLGAMKQSSVPPLARGVSPGIDLVGLMLPYSPLHCLLMAEVNLPIIATSGNLSEEPICINEAQAFERLGHIADCFLTHDRRIVRGLDDSIVRCIAGEMAIFRRARGYAPLSFKIGSELNDVPILGVGGHLKNTIALSRAGRIYQTQHLGNLETAQAYELFEQELSSMPELYGVSKPSIVCDLHPDYFSTKEAKRLSDSPLAAQHHLAHVAACMGEHGIVPPCLGVAFDGSGYGTDGTVWGGEFLLIESDWSFKRFAYLRPFRLPGGERAIEQPRRAALGVLYELLGDSIFTSEAPSEVQMFIASAFQQREIKTLRGMLGGSVNSPLCSSAGRLFDAVAALIGVRLECDFEGQAAMELESLAARARSGESADYESSLLQAGESIVLDWAGMVLGVLAAHQAGSDGACIARGFHESLARAVQMVCLVSGVSPVVLSGGVFQNRIFVESTLANLKQSGLDAFVHRLVPPNDGGISFGQVVWARQRQRQL